MIIRFVNAVLILFAFYMGVKQGWAMVSGKPEMLDMFGRWNISKPGVSSMGLFTLLSAVLILFPRTFLWGNFLMAAAILLIICLHLMDKNIKGALTEFPFLLLSLVIIYLQYPLQTKPG